MDTPAPDPATAPDRRTLVIHCVFLAALTYCAHFWHSGRFGLYEDDIVVVPAAAGLSIAGLARWVTTHVLSFQQGRPVGFTVWMLLPWLGFKLGNLHAVYSFCSLVVCANVVLFYLLLRRCFGQSIALLAALTYCLYPADTSRALLVHTDILQPAVLFFLIGAHCYLSKRYVPAYLSGLAVLLCYESPFLPFLLVPLLRPPIDRTTLRRLAIHLAICAGLVLGTVGLRLAVGEARVVQASSTAHSVLYRVVTNVYLGPSTATKLLFTDARYTFDRLANLQVTIPAAVAFLACTTLLLLCQRKHRNDSRPAVLHPLLLGLAMFLTGYTFAISPEHYPPTAEFGRLTSVHLAAALGASLAVGSLLEGLLRASDRARLRIPLLVLYSGYFATLTGFAFLVQQGFVYAHRAQQNYWTQIVQLCPDLDDGTTILVEGKFRSVSEFVIATSWSDPLVLPNLFQFPSTWRHPPLLVRLRNDANWTESLGRDGDALVWTREFSAPTRPFAGDPLVEGKTILLRANRQSLERIDTTMTLQGRPFHFPPAPATRPSTYPPGPLYPLFVKDRAAPKGPVLKIPTSTPPIG